MQCLKYWQVVKYSHNEWCIMFGNSIHFLNNMIYKGQQFDVMKYNISIDELYKNG